MVTSHTGVFETSPSFASSPASREAAGDGSRASILPPTWEISIEFSDCGLAQRWQLWAFG